jgi:hypothetical protein
MAKFFRAALTAATFFLTGCAIHPLPEDVTGVPTYTIVRQVRCEARQAIVDTAVGWLTNPKNIEEGKVDPASRAIGLQFADGERRTQDFVPELFRGRVAQIVKLFFDTGVAYNFDLAMTEVNNLDTQINLLKPFTTSKFTMGIKGGFDRQRANERIFTVTDSFSGLVRLPDSYCDGRSVNENYNYNVPPNYAYPATGKIGVQRMIQDFIELTLFANLGGPKAAPKGPPTLVDTLAFQTIITGTLTPMVTFSPVGKALSVADASLTGLASRTDLHTITMGLSIAGPGLKLVTPVRSALFTTPLLTAHPATSAEANAADAVNQVLTLKLFKPTINVTAP